MDTREKARARRRIRERIRAKLAGTPERPRLAVHKTLHHIYAQVIDDQAGRTLVAASTLDKELRGRFPAANTAAAKAVGALIAARAKDKGLRRVVFDRGGYRYHGNVKALADAARENGLEF